MKYLVLLYESEALWASKSEADQMAEIDEHMSLTADFGQGVLAGEALQPTTTATTVRVRDGRTVVSDGPFAETREQLGGFYLIEAADLDEATAFAARIPSARLGCVEVRPVLPIG